MFRKKDKKPVDAIQEIQEKFALMLQEATEALDAMYNTFYAFFEGESQYDFLKLDEPFKERVKTIALAIKDHNETLKQTLKLSQEDTITLDQKKAMPEMISKSKASLDRKISDFIKDLKQHPEFESEKYKLARIERAIGSLGRAADQLEAQKKQYDFSGLPSDLQEEWGEIERGVTSQIK